MHKCRGLAVCTDHPKASIVFVPKMDLWAYYEPYKTWPDFRLFKTLQEALDFVYMDSNMWITTRYEVGVGV